MKSPLPDYTIGAGSELSVTSGGGVQYHSVTTPSLMSAVCRLLSNLLSQAPEDTLNSLHRDATLKALTRFAGLYYAVCTEQNYLDSYGCHWSGKSQGILEFVMEI